MNSKITILVHAIILAVITSCNSSKIEITDLQCEYLNSPLGVDVQTPRFSWKMISEERNVSQSAYQIILGESLEKVSKKKGNIWDSGKISSDKTFNICYEGEDLKSNRNYFWRVSVWDKNGKQTWSQPATFHTSFFKESDWKADWITTPEEITDASPLFRKEFNIDKKISSAYAYTTACGYYEFYLNGKKVGGHVLDPGITDYRKTILYSVYDVSKLLIAGNNAAGAMLGNGAYNLLRTEGRYSWHRSQSLGNPCYFMQLVITYEDGTQDIIITDNSWKYSWGPITFNNIYGGEDYDAQKEQDGWASTNFDDENWKSVKVADEPGGTLKSQMMAPIEVVESISPIVETNPESGVYLYDLGQNIVGWWRIQIKGIPGMTIRIRGAETLNDSVFPKQLTSQDNLSTKHRYHSQTWTDYTLKSNEIEIYEPRFFYSGFRYIEVAVNDKQKPESLKVEGRVVRSAFDHNGTFESSDSLLNQIHRAGVWAQMGNMLSYPTDCPHREKGAYNGDGQVIAEASMHDFQMAAFYTKWLNDMRDSQEENGRIPNTSPILVGGSGGGVAWGSAYVLIPWWMYHYYGDTEILKEHYPTMKDYIAYLKKLGTTDENPDEPYIINFFGGYWFSLGEWCSPGRSDCPIHDVVNTFYYYYDTYLMSKIAELLGNEQDAAYFASLSDTIKTAFIEKFYNEETAVYGTDSVYQTYQLLALVGDLIPKGKRAKVYKTVIDDIKKNRNGHLNTGIIGTKYLWPILVEGNNKELALEIATQTTYPSFGYWIKNGSTTLLETWSGKNSHNHQMFGSITEYFYKYLAGIQSPLQDSEIGYKHVYLKPVIPEKLDWVKATLNTVSGKIISEWEKQTNSFNYHVEVPANTTATVVLPASGSSNYVLLEGKQIVWENDNLKEKIKGIASVSANSNDIMVNIGSGNYHFTMTER